MALDRMDVPHDVIETGIRLSVATLCGAVVGCNREAKHRPAGLRTLMLVSLGAAAFALLGDQIAHEAEIRVDPTRIVAGIVGGIGFLGAGTIMRARGSVRGVTTAAAIWVTAGLGSACGLGYYPIAGFGVLLAMMVFFTSVVALGLTNMPPPPLTAELLAIVQF